MCLKLHDSLIRLEPESRTFIVTSDDDGLLRTKTGCTCSLLSSTVYDAWLKLTPTSHFANKKR